MLCCDIRVNHVGHRQCIFEDLEGKGYLTYASKFLICELCKPITEAAIYTSSRDRTKTCSGRSRTAMPDDHWIPDTDCRCMLQAITSWELIVTGCSSAVDKNARVPMHRISIAVG